MEVKDRMTLKVVLEYYGMSVDHEFLQIIFRAVSVGGGVK